MPRRQVLRPRPAPAAAGHPGPAGGRPLREPGPRLGLPHPLAAGRIVLACQGKLGFAGWVFCLGEKGGHLTS